MINSIIDEIRHSNIIESRDYGVRGNVSVIRREMRRFYEDVFNGYFEGSFRELEQRRCLTIAFLACELVRYHTGRTMDEIRKDVRTEIDRAIKKHQQPIRNLFEAYEVLDEEVEELKQEVRKDDFIAAVGEAIHVAAVCVRIIYDLYKHH